MVAINPFSYEQVAIIFIFLSVLLGILLYVRKNSDKLNFKLQTEKSISVLENVAISQSERLRLIKVGDETFLMASGKGVTTQLIKIDPENSFFQQIKINKTENKKSSIHKKPELSETATRKSNTINLTKRHEQSSTLQRKSIFKAIKQARDKNPLLGLGK